MHVMSMRIQTSMLEPDLRQPKNRLALLARVIGQLIATVDPVQLDHVLFEFLRTELRLDAFFSFERTDDNRLQLATCCGTPAMEADAAERLSRLAPCADAADRSVPVHVTAIQASVDTQISLLKSIGLNAFVCLPLLVGERLVGTFGFGRRWTDQDRKRT